MQLSHNWLFLGVVHKMDPVCIMSLYDFFLFSHSVPFFLGGFVFVFDIFRAFLNLVSLEMNVLITLSHIPVES